MIILSNKQVLQLAKKYVDENDADGFCSSFMLMTPQMFQMAVDQAKAEQIEEWIEKIEGIKIKPHGKHDLMITYVWKNEGYNESLDKVISLLNGEKV